MNEKEKGDRVITCINVEINVTCDKNHYEGFFFAVLALGSQEEEKITKKCRKKGHSGHIIMPASSTKTQISPLTMITESKKYICTIN